MLPQNTRLAEGGRFERPSRRATPVFGTGSLPIRTTFQYVLALRLSRAEADELLRAAGYALSPSIIDDVIFASCIDDGVFNLFAVNQRLHDNGAKIIPPV